MVQSGSNHELAIHTKCVILSQPNFQSYFLIFYTLVENYEKDDFYREEIDPDPIIHKVDPNAGTTKENDESLEVVEDNFVSFWLSGSSVYNSDMKILSFCKYFNQ